MNDTPAPDAERAPARVAIVGTGGIAAVHADNIRQERSGMTLVAATDIDAPRLAAFAAAQGVPHTFPDLQALLDGVEVDVVHLCSPPWLHAEQAIACLERGVSVLSEKPSALSLTEFDRIVAAERRSTASFGTVSQHRFGGRAVALRRIVERGDFGALRLALCNTLWFRPDPYFDVAWRGRWHTEGGGPTIGHGIHQMDLLLSIAGPWTSVRATARRSARRTDTEDLSAGTITFGSGATAVFVNSFLSPDETSQLRFDFDEATVELRHLYGYSDGNWTFTPAPDGDGAAARVWEETAGGGGSGHSAQFAEVSRALAEKRPVPVASEDARATLELIAAIYASAFTGDEVRRGDLTPDSPFARSMGAGRAPWAPVKEALTR